MYMYLYSHCYHALCIIFTNVCVVECFDGDARLANYEVDGTSAIAGALEVCINRRWASICNDADVDSDNLRVIELACRAMGYSGIE